MSLMRRRANMKRWVVGFLFSEDLKKVVLIKKNRPPWQAGLLNGVGGNIKDGENTAKAMIREFKEEADVYYQRWRPLAEFNGLDGEGNECVCYFFYGIGDAFEFNNTKTTTDESVLKVPVKDLPENLVKNLYWLIPLCLDSGVDKPIWFTGEYPK